MSKKSGLILLLAAMVLFTGLTAGLLIGRNAGYATVPLSKYDRFSADSSTGTFTAQPHSNGRLNINTATADELTMLPGIGETIAQRIVDYRQQIGAFSSIEELAQVKGIGKARIDAISDYITVGG